MEMRTLKNLCFSFFLFGTLDSSIVAQTADAAASQHSPTASPVVTVDQAIDRVIAREHNEVATIRRYNPVIETYIQDMKTDKEMGAIPVKDHYFLGQADLSKAIVPHNIQGSDRAS